MATRIKVDFTLERPAAEAVNELKPGGILVIRLPEPSDDVTDENAPSKDAVLSCFNLQGVLAGVVPTSASRQLSQYSEAQASVRSIKRDVEGTVQHIMLRVVITEAGPMQLAKPEPAAQTDTAVAGTGVYPEDDDDGFRLRRKQLEMLVHDAPMRLQLADERLQAVLHKIEGGQGGSREKALEAALQGPDFQAFADKVLTLLDAGVVQPAPDTATTPAPTAAAAAAPA